MVTTTTAGALIGAKCGAVVVPLAGSVPGSVVDGGIGLGVGVGIVAGYEACQYARWYSKLSEKARNSFSQEVVGCGFDQDLVCPVTLVPPTCPVRIKGCPNR